MAAPHVATTSGREDAEAEAEEAADARAAVLGSDDTLIFESNITWKFRIMGGAGFIKACFWTWLGYSCHFYPEQFAGMSPLWSVVGAGAATAMLLAAQSLASHTVAEVVRTHGGMTARITTFNVLGARTTPVDVMIDTLSTQDDNKSYHLIRVGDAKTWLLLDRKGYIPHKGAFENLANGRTMLEPGARRNVWLPAKDPATGNTYYYHPVTREVRWDDPSKEDA